MDAVTLVTVAVPMPPQEAKPAFEAHPVTVPPAPPAPPVQAGPNYSYTFSGPDALAPLQVYDDGRSTYLKYRTLSDPLPVIASVSPQGKKTKVDFHVVDDQIVIDRISGEWTITHSGGTITVYNEVLNPR